MTASIAAFELLSSYVNDPASRSNAHKALARLERGERLPLKTGSCLAGWHEGSRPKTRGGDPIKTCEMYLTCPCKCHTDLDELFALSDKVRELVKNPEYVPVKPAFVRPTIAAPGLLSGESVDREALISPAPGIVPGEKVKQFEATPSGRIAKGQLERWVKQVVDEWFIESINTKAMIEPCTPAWIAERIAEIQGIAPPLTGGINHIFRRWADAGIAEFGTSPARFEHYTPEAIAVGMDRMREKYARRNQ